MDINTIVIIGNLTKNLELKYTTTGMPVGDFCIAVNRSVKKDGEWSQEADFFDCKTLGKTAESLQQYMTKGKKVGIEGYLRQERWTANDGTKRSRVIIYANNIVLLSPKDNGGAGVTTGDDCGYSYGYEG
jgi:single-strand DNA-binding protein